MSLGESITHTVPPVHGLAIWWLGQSGYVFGTGDGLRLAVDPFLSGTMEGRPEDFPRLIPPPLRPAELNVGVLLVTHAHTDHLDLEVLRASERRDALAVIGPPSVKDALPVSGILDADVHILRAGDSEEVGSTRVTATFCIPNEEAAIDSIGYIIEFANGITVYHTGDTGFHPFLYYLSRFKLDLMFPCINGKYGNMGVEEAAELTRYLRPKVVVPQHYGMFALNDENPYDFVGCLKKSFAEAEAAVLSVGDTYLYDPSPSNEGCLLQRVDHVE